MGTQSVDLAEATVGQLMVPVSDLTRAIPFYRDALGLPFLFSAPPQMAFFQCGEVRLLVGVPEGAAIEPGSGSLIYFRVDDITAVHRTLAARGVDFSEPPHVVHRTPSSELWMAGFADPDGNRLALMSEVAAD